MGRKRTSSEVKVFADVKSLVQSAAERIVEISHEAVSKRGRFTFALSGGSTPRPLYSLLASDPFAAQIDWSLTHIFWGDERCVPPDDPQSNFKMARETLLDKVPLPAANIHRMHGEDDPEESAAAYEEELRTFFGVNPKDGSPREGFDFLLLGMGENGHTASIFPGTAAVSETIRWVMALYVQALSMWRITLTPVVINTSPNVTFIVSEAKKAERVREVLEGPFQPDRLPTQIVRPVHGRLSWLLDEAAAARLTRR